MLIYEFSCKIFGIDTEIMYLCNRVLTRKYSYEGKERQNLCN